MERYVYPSKISVAANLSAYNRYGAGAVVARFFSDYCLRLSYKTVCRIASLRPGKFEFNGRQLLYSNNRYNDTYANERTLEIPLVQDLLDHQKPGRILEVGSVLSHYRPVSWEVLDKFEQRPGVINQDVTTFTPTQPYDLVISVSTLEHVGVDDTVHRPELAVNALKRMKQWLAPGGSLLITVPFGYNHALDHFLLKDSLPFTRRYAFKRISVTNKWRPVHPKDLWNAQYGWPYNNANGLFVGLYTRS